MVDDFNCSRYLLAYKRYVINVFFYCFNILGVNFSRIETFSISSMKLELSQAVDKVAVTQKEINELILIMILKHLEDLKQQTKRKYY